SRDGMGAAAVAIGACGPGGRGSAGTQGDFGSAEEGGCHPVISGGHAHSRRQTSAAAFRHRFDGDEIDGSSGASSGLWNFRSIWQASPHTQAKANCSEIWAPAHDGGLENGSPNLLQGSAKGDLS